MIEKLGSLDNSRLKILKLYPNWSISWGKVVVFVLAGVMGLLFVLPLFALIWRAFSLPGNNLPEFQAIITATLLSLATTAVSMALIIIFGTPLAYVLARYQFPLKRPFTTFVELPIVMPPVVAGLALLSAFGRRGLLGESLTAYGIVLPFSLAAVVLVQVFVAAPFYIRAVQSRLEAFPREIEEAAKVDGSDGFKLFWLVMLPLSSRPFLSGLILSWARALGEFGATMLFAGNLMGRTQTLPLLVYSSLEQDLRVTFITALILLVLAIFSFALTRWLARLDDKDADPLAF